MRCERVWRNARLATMTGTGLGLVEDGVLACADGRIAWVGAASDAPVFEAADTVDCDGRWITPGLIDAHTHLVWAGDRAAEFEARLGGASYEEIARAGGGVLSTMKATRAASEDELVTAALTRLDALIAEGVTTIEVKSGYGLTTADEMKLLRAARRLCRERDVRVRATLLAAHTLPPEFAGRSIDYIYLIASEMIPTAVREGLADAVDVFCESIGFSHDDTDMVFSAAVAHGLPVKLHADQLSNSHGARLAALYGALSADHLEHTDAEGIAAMTKGGTVATLLPGAFYFTRETKLPPVQALRDAGVPIALATDCNPGTSPLTSLLLAMNMGATLFRLTVDECLIAVTRNAARALGLHDEIGTLEAGKACDLAIWDIERPAELVYRIGFNPLWRRVMGGR